MPAKLNHKTGISLVQATVSELYMERIFTGQKQARVEVYIDDLDGEWNIQLLENLEERKEEIQTALGNQTLDWQRLENRRACRIALTRSGSIDDNAGTLSEIQEWMVDNLLNFKRVFGPCLAELVG